MSLPTISKLTNCNYYPGFQVGVEFEIESVNEFYGDKSPVPIMIKEENSLRNNGHEIISKYPGSIEKALKIHESIFNETIVTFHNINDACSDRGSIHVHVNFSDRTFDDVVKFITYYYLLEPIFFNYVNDSRKNNIFTVPLSSTHMLRVILESQDFGLSQLTYLNEKWHKYTALNAKSLCERGTIEFRHFEITSNYVRFAGWLKKIEKLYNLVFSNRFVSIPNLATIYRIADEFSTISYPYSVLEGIERNYTDYLLYTINPTRALITNRIKLSKKDEECVELPE